MLGSSTPTDYFELSGKNSAQSSQTDDRRAHNYWCHSLESPGDQTEIRNTPDSVHFNGLV